MPASFAAPGWTPCHEFQVGRNRLLMTPHCVDGTKAAESHVWRLTLHFTSQCPACHPPTAAHGGTHTNTVSQSAPQVPIDINWLPQLTISQLQNLRLCVHAFTKAETVAVAYARSPRFQYRASCAHHVMQSRLGRAGLVGSPPVMSWCQALLG